MQFSDHPPPEQRNTAKVHGVQGAAGPVMERVCAVVTSVVPGLLAGLRKSLSIGEANAVGGNLDNSFTQNGMDDTNFKRLLSMLYSYRTDDQSYIANGNVYATNHGAQLIAQAQLEVKNACLAGRFGRFDAIKNTAPEQARTDSARSGTGTGFWVDTDRIATSWHVVEKASRITVTDAKGGTHDAKVLSHDVDNDVAVLQIFGA